MVNKTQVEKMTAEAFRQLPETTQPTELIDGEMIVSPAPTDAHQKLSLLFVSLLLSFDIQGDLRHAPLDVYLDEQYVVQPDVFWVSVTNQRCQLVNNYWHGAPDLVIEILSPSSVRRDRVEKFQLYERHGVREYWIADPTLQTVEVWQLHNQQFAYVGTFTATATFTSPLLNRPIDCTTLF